MVTAKDDSLPTNAEVFDADADEVDASRSSDHYAPGRNPRARILAILDRKTYDIIHMVLTLELY
jgi:hypothetical protein